jgi:hypothetical protein
MRISHCLPAGTNIYVLVIIAEVRFLNVRTVVCTDNLNAGVAVMKSTQDGA